MLSSSQAYSNTRIAANRLQHNPIQNASLSVHGHFSTTTLRHPSPSQAHSNIRIAQLSPAQSNTEYKSQYMGILP